MKIPFYVIFNLTVVVIIQIQILYEKNIDIHKYISKIQPNEHEEKNKYYFLLHKLSGMSKRRDLRICRSRFKPYLCSY